MIARIVSAMILVLAGLGSARSAELQAYAEALADATWFSGAILVTQGEETLLRAAFASEDAPGKIQLSAGTRFRIGSITKAFTASLVAMAERDGLLSASDLVSVHLSQLPPAWSTIRVEHLVHHRSGIPDIEDMPEYAAIKSENRRPLETIDLLGEKDLLFEPGSQFAYSSSG